MWTSGGKKRAKSCGRQLWMAPNYSLNILSFLDLDISVNQEGFTSKLYDKRRDFSFNVYVATFPN